MPSPPPSALYPALPHLYAAMATLGDPTRTWDGSGVAVPDFVAVARRHRVISYLRHNLDRVEGSDAFLGSLRAEGDTLSLQVLHQLKSLHEVIGMLGAAGLRVMTVKGPTLAIAAYGSVTARGPGDLDIWVAPQDVAAAVRLLREAGATSYVDYPEPSDNWVWRYHLMQSYEMTLRYKGHWIDLHWRLSPAVGDLPPFEEAWAERVNVELPGGVVATTSLRHTLQHSCSHAAKDGFAWLRNLIDVRRLADLADTSDLASLTRPQRETLTLTEQMLGRSQPRSRRARQVLTDATRAQARERPGVPQAFSARHSVSVIAMYVRLNPTPGNAVRMVLWMAVPAPFLSGREQQRPPVALLGAFVDRVAERWQRHRQFTCTGLDQ